MLAVRKTTPAHGFSLDEVPEPELRAADDVVVEVEAAGICGSDVHAYEWTGGYEWMTPLMPLTLGHEFSGRIVARGSDAGDLPLGQRVTVWPSSGCGRCPSCRGGEPENCLNKKTIGLMKDGGFARRVVVPAAACFPVPASIDAELAALTEPLCVGAQAVEVGDVRLGDTVVVLGPGTIGQAIALFARRAGASPVIVVGRNDDERLATVRRLGLLHTIDVARDDLGPAVERLVGGKVDRVFEATGAGASIGDGLGLLRKGGVLVAAGIHARPAEIDLTSLVRGKLQIRGTHGARPATWKRVLKVLAESGEDFRPMISHRLPLAAAAEGFELARRKVASKVMLMPAGA